jgi:uncharacterized protein (DUF1697 family)
MPTYVALLRGIMPQNPNMHSAKLKGLFESLGFKNVSTVIGSGNVVFTSPSRDTAALEKKIEAAFPKQLGFTSTTIIRSQREIDALIKKDPFEGVKDEKPNYLVVTFFKSREKELCTVIDLSESKTPQFMSAIEKKHGKELTTRTWKTVHKVAQRMASLD